jgi:ABC-type multidrug transport system fused ATPase/permease subunit
MKRLVSLVGQVNRYVNNTFVICLYIIGAGKSSLFQGLFRLIERSTIDGEILIDDIDISRITLDHLRSCLSIIPQIPVLFRGTLRYNLDPFEIYTDDECLAALEAVQLKHRICAHPAGLYLPVVESGSAFSVGERQLICLARAILKQSKILLIDEATANVDQVTDRLIQAVIVDKFRDRTILTIAHRLKTISENDRILVMEQGRVTNFDMPKNILQ